MDVQHAIAGVVVSSEEETEVVQQQQKYRIVSLVYEAVVRVCGRELRSDHSSKGDTDNNNDTTACASAAARPDTNHPSDDNEGSTHNQQEAKKEDDTLAILHWREQLCDLVQRTVTIKKWDLPQPPLGTAMVERTKLYDIEIRTAAALFRRFQHPIIVEQQQPEQQPTNDEESATPPTTTPPHCIPRQVLTVVSDMGVVKTVLSAYDLAHHHLLPLLEASLQEATISDHVRVAPHSGFLCAVSHGRYQQIHLGMMKHNGQPPLLPAAANEPVPKSPPPAVLLCPCPQCPAWCKGSKGLWWHLQQQHAQQHGTAMDIATVQGTRNHTALVLYTGNGGEALNDTLTTMTMSSSSSSSVVSNNQHSSNVQQQTRTVPSPAQGHQFDVISPKSREICPNSIQEQPHHRDSVETDPWGCVQRDSVSDLRACLFLLKTTTKFGCATTTDKHGAVLLHWAAGRGCLSMVQFLVEDCQCDPDTPQRGHRAFAGRTALHWAARNGHAATVVYLLEHARKLDEFVCPTASLKKNEEIAVATPRLTARLEAATADGTTAFAWAAWQGHLEVLRVLHDRYHCQTTTMNHFGCNPVLWAAQGSNENAVSVVIWLEQSGCPIHCINHSGHGLLHKAAQRGRQDLCAWFFQEKLFHWLLLEDERSTSDTSISNATPPSIDSLAGVSIATIIRQVGPDNDGCTPSDLAGMANHASLAKFLSLREIALVGAVAKAHQKVNLAAPWPEWLLPLPRTRSIIHKNNVDFFCWEPGAGVFRMRVAIS